MWPACGCSFFLFLTGWYGECEIEFSHMGKNSGNPDGCAKNNFLIWVETAENPIWCALIYVLCAKKNRLRKLVLSSTQNRM